MTPEETDNDLVTITNDDGSVLCMTDHDPAGELYVVATVDPFPVPDPDSCSLADGQTAQTLAMFYDAGYSRHGDLGLDQVPVHDRAEALDLVDEAGPEWAVYKLVPVNP